MQKRDESDSVSERPKVVQSSNHELSMVDIENSAFAKEIFKLEYDNSDV